MVVKNYFTETPVTEWCLVTAFNNLEREHPSSTTRLNLERLRNSLREALSSTKEEVVAEATKKLQKWKSVKKQIVPKEDNLTNINKNNNYSGAYSTIITQPSNTTIILNSSSAPSASSSSANTSHIADQIGESINTAANIKRQANQTGIASSHSSRTKRKVNQMNEPSSSPANTNCDADIIDEASSSGKVTWNSREKPLKKRKYLNVYLSNYYTNSNLTQKSDWDGVTSDLITYRQTSIDGAQARRFLSNSRILSLSHIYLLSPIDTCVISKVNPHKQKLIMDSILPNSSASILDHKTLSFCNEARTCLGNRALQKDELEDALELLKNKYASKEVKIMYKLICDLKYFKKNTANFNDQGEAALTIDVIRPYLIHCLASQIELIKDDWMTYNLPNPHESQAYMPDYVLYLDNISSQNVEFLFVEIKRKGNYHNNSKEDDIVKLGKQMQVAIDKLIRMKVKKPEIVGILVTDLQAVVYKMDLRYEGIYRMIEICRFHFARDCVDDIFLLPTIVEKMTVIKSIVQATIDSVYNALDGNCEDSSSFIRDPCKSPVLVEYDSVKD